METIQSYREIAEQIRQGKRIQRKTQITEARFMEETLSGGAYLVICGGGHISRPLCSLAKMLGYYVVVIDDREEFANTERFCEADEVYCMDFTKVLAAQNFPEHAFYVIVTRGHQKDYECLKVILTRKSSYIGMIGSRVKVAQTMERLKKEGVPEAVCQKIHAPIGLSIGANTPEEIAVSISAEMIQEKSIMKETELPKEIVDWLIEKEDEMVMMTIVSKRGSAPRGEGTRMLIDKNGNAAGTIGGGAIEYAACQKAVTMFGTNEQKNVETYDLTTKEAVNLGMICGGYVEILYEKITKKSSCND